MTIKQSSVNYTDHLDFSTATHLKLSDDMLDRIKRNFPFSLTSK